jgi:hypothetical protein
MQQGYAGEEVKPLRYLLHRIGRIQSWEDIGNKPSTSPPSGSIPRCLQDRPRAPRFQAPFSCIGGMTPPVTRPDPGPDPEEKTRQETRATPRRAPALARAFDAAEPDPRLVCDAKLEGRTLMRGPSLPCGMEPGDTAKPLIDRGGSADLPHPRNEAPRSMGHESLIAVELTA